MAAALPVAYTMTVAVSVAAAVDNIISAIPDLNSWRVAANLAFIGFPTAMNLRGVRESLCAFAIPTYGFVLGMTGIPWQLQSSRGVTPREEHTPGEIRRRVTGSGDAP